MLYRLHSNVTDDLLPSKGKIDYSSRKNTHDIKNLVDFVTSSAVVSQINNGACAILEECNLKLHTFLQLFAKMWEFIIWLSFKTVDCIVIHRNTDTEIEYFLEEYSFLASRAMATCHQFYSNVTCVSNHILHSVWYWKPWQVAKKIFWIFFIYN